MRTAVNHTQIQPNTLHIVTSWTAMTPLAASGLSEASTALSSISTSCQHISKCYELPDRFKPLRKVLVVLARNRRALLHSLEVLGLASPVRMSCTRRRNHSSHSAVQCPQLNPLLCHTAFFGHQDISAVCFPLPVQMQRHISKPCNSRHSKADLCKSYTCQQANHLLPLAGP